MATRGFDDDELAIPSSYSRRHHEPPPRSHGPADPAARSSREAAVGSPRGPMREKIKTEQRIGAYKVIRTLGEGSFGKVKLAVHNGTGQQVALKIIARKKLISRDMAGRVEREIEYLQLLRHPHIIKLYTVIKTQTEIIMVLEYAGGELFDYIVQKGRMKEAEARRFFQQMICAVEYCHRHKIVHRDLKPENLLLDENLDVKIADFGLSNIMTDGNFLKTSCGSPNYAAPEVIGGKLYAGPEVDVWSCGVILYVLLAGRLPFDDDHIPSLFAKIARGSYSIPQWMAPGAVNLIKKMLVVNPVQRITIDDIREDPWFQTDLPSYLHPPTEEFLNTGVDPNKAIKKSDIAPGAPPKVQEKLHNEVTEKISKTMGYGKKDVEEALESEEPSAIKDAYMIVRENKLMEVNQKISPLVAASEPATSPMPSISSARSASSSLPTPRPYTSKVGILPSSLPAYHKVYIERAKAGIQDTTPQGYYEPSSREEAARRLNPHSRSSQIRLDDMAARPQSLTPVTAPGETAQQGQQQGKGERQQAKKSKATKWQFGIRARSYPADALLCIHKALHQLGATYLPDEDYDKARAQEREEEGGGGGGGSCEHSAGGSFDDEYEGAPLRRCDDDAASNSVDPMKRYRLPADPWRIRVRWKTDQLGMNAAHRPGRAPLSDRAVQLVVAVHMDIQIYETPDRIYLVDFKCSGYETNDGRLLEDKEVMSPYPFLDVAARLISQLADRGTD